jgi:hypothetical protein
MWPWDEVREWQPVPVMFRVPDEPEA